MSSSQVDDSDFRFLGIPIGSIAGLNRNSSESGENRSNSIGLNRNPGTRNPIGFSWERILSIPMGIRPFRFVVTCRNRSDPAEKAPETDRIWSDFSWCFFSYTLIFAHNGVRSRSSIIHQYRGWKIGSRFSSTLILLNPKEYHLC
jgi:hypothetical protein